MLVISYCFRLKILPISELNRYWYTVLAALSLHLKLRCAILRPAFLLKIRVQYCYKLMVPLVNGIIGSLSELNKQRTNQQVYETLNDPKFADANRYYVNTAAGMLSSYQQLCGDRANSNEGFIISADAIVRMQYPAYEEDEDPDVGSNMCDSVKMACP